MVNKRLNVEHPEYTVRIGSLMALPAVLKQFGKEPNLVMSNAGIDIGIFDNPDNRISYKARSKLLAHCAVSTNCNHLGLMLGQQTGLKSLGLIGLLVKYSTDVNTALQNLCRYIHLQVQGAVIALKSDKNSATLSYETLQTDTEAGDQVGDTVVAIMFNVLNELCGSSWKPNEICFIRQKPENIQPYRSFFKSQLSFNNTQTAVVFDAKWLQHRMLFCDLELQQFLQQQIEQLELQHSQDFLEQVRSVLRAAILTGHAHSNDVAAMFSMHSRTMSRHLEKQGVSFQGLLDQCRFEVAKQLLQKPNIEVGFIAETLKFADASSFTRTFKRWSAATPTQWRTTYNTHN